MMPGVITAELVANALKHVPQAEKYELALSINGGGALLEVWDPSPKPPVIVNLPDAEFGRGLHIVTALASRWNYYPLPSGQGRGKVVWALLAGRDAVFSGRCPR